MQHAVRNFPGRLSAVQQSLGRGCLQTACATQTLPVRGTAMIIQQQKTMGSECLQPFQPIKGLL